MTLPIDIIRRFGTQAALARALGVGPTTVNNWVTRGHIPSRHWPKLVRLANRRGVRLSLEELACQ